jgi:hypothetical protein
MIKRIGKTIISRPMHPAIAVRWCLSWIFLMGWSTPSDAFALRRKAQ